ncbi:Cationic amino acid transporter, C-terminal,Amino acid/polyamine transporter I [Cinara cedri]|uniref:Cationic amino acid transporter, C-terminal,Amino acid/polyamine transporter I n=1 Tax=Cinara cedri TaxID=506608 RepID=A0A5E4MU06_9HEMI|nr:Cationic amino acid transporter, C-terminal,Amino acid/polyamine transporter I [Cinara cedri]
MTGNTLYRTLCRKKTFTAEDTEPGKEKFRRVLTVFDLTSLGVGATLGSGVYILAGTVAKSIAGPAVVLSFVVAAIVSSFSGVCYAEFAGRVPKAGSAYIYSYVTVGEFIAFIIGWNLFIDHTIGTASVGKAMTNCLDAILGDPQKRYMKKHYPMHVDFLGEYPDIGSFFFIMLIAIVLAWGVRKSSTLNSVFTVLNLLTVGTVITSGIYFANLSNWFIPKSEIPVGVKGGEGGFLPFGWTGVVVGAARCFYGFIGFESISTTGEETKNPKKTIPLAIMFSLLVATLVYVGVASVLTLMWPYYDQDTEAPFSVVYEHLGMPVIKYMVTCGAIFALFTTLLGCLFPIPRILYSMASDGLLFEFLSIVNEKTKTPLVATLISGLGAGILSTVFNLEQLVEMTSIGTLISYLIVCVCVLILRYKNNDTEVRDNDTNIDSNNSFFNSWFDLANAKIPNADTQFASRILISIYTITAFVFCICSVNIDCYGGAYQVPIVVTIVFTVAVLLIIPIVLNRLPQAIENLMFKVPFVPFIPCLSIVLNFYLMMELSYKTWIRFGSGIIIGIFIYVIYGARNSIEGKKQSVSEDIKDGQIQKIAL